MQPLAVSSTVGIVSLLLAYVAGSQIGPASAVLLIVAVLGVIGSLLYLGAEEYNDGRRDGGGPWED